MSHKRNPQLLNSDSERLQKADETDGERKPPLESVPSSTRPPEPSEGGSKNYFVMHHFRSVKQKQKPAPKTVPENEPGQSQSPKQGIKLIEQPNSRPTETQQTVVREDRKTSKSSAINKSLLGELEIREMFRNPEMDSYCDQPSTHLSAGDRSQNFRLSNVLSADYSGSEARNSQFKLSADISGTALNGSIFGDCNPLCQPTTNTPQARFELKNLAEEKAFQQNISMPLKRNVTPQDLEVEAKRRSQSRDKRKAVALDGEGDSADSSRSDEYLCNAFSVHKSCINTQKLESRFRGQESFEDEEKVVLTMRAEEERTLSLMNDETEELDKVAPPQKGIAKNRLQYKNKLFVAASKSDLQDSILPQKEVIDPAAQLLSYPYQLSKPIVIMSGGLKEPSMFSTQDSKPSKNNKSMNADQFAATEPVTILQIPGMSGRMSVGPVFQVPPYLPQLTAESDDASYYTDRSGPFLGDEQEITSSSPSDQRPKGNADLRHNRRTIPRKSHPIPNNDGFRINIDNIEPNRTTVMVRNIPNRYTKEMMMTEINRDFQDCYDFFYLPIDFERGANIGYAFVNFVDARYIRDFYLAFHGSKWRDFNSDKVCEVSYARIQGLAACNEHFKHSSLMKQTVSS